LLIGIVNKDFNNIDIQIWWIS